MSYLRNNCTVIVHWVDLFFPFIVKEWRSQNNCRLGAEEGIIRESGTGCGRLMMWTLSAEFAHTRSRTDAHSSFSPERHQCVLNWEWWWLTGWKGGTLQDLLQCSARREASDDKAAETFRGGFVLQDWTRFNQSLCEAAAKPLISTPHSAGLHLAVCVWVCAAEHAQYVFKHFTTDLYQLVSAYICTYI